MQKKSSSSFSSSSSPATTPQLPLRPPTASARYHTGSRPILTSTAHPTPAIIPLDYNYETMSPSASSLQHGRPTSETTSVMYDLDDQYSSLFGDPVPPPQSNDYFRSAFDSFRTSLDLPASSEEDAFGTTITFNNGGRIFPNAPYTTASLASASSRAASLTPQHATGIRNFDVLPTPLPRLKPPDIQVLANSSGGSSTEHTDSPNFTLLAPQNIQTKSDLYEANKGGVDMRRLKESYTISDAQGIREYMNNESTMQCVTSSDPNDDNETPICVPSESTMKQPTAALRHQYSNDSYSSTEWFRPVLKDYPEFGRIPKLRPSSKKIISMKCNAMPPSALATMLHDSNGSSSGDELQTQYTQAVIAQEMDDDDEPPERPPAPSAASMCAMETDFILSPSQYLQADKSTVKSLETTPPPAAPPPLIEQEQHVERSTPSIKRKTSPVIVKDSIATGGDYRVEQARLHKKTAFTIISNKSPQPSRAHSPSLHRTLAKHTTPQSTTSSTTNSKPLAKPRTYLHRKSLTSTELRLPHINVGQGLLPTVDDSPRPSVQFNMTGRYSPSKVMPQKSILQQRDSLTSSQDTFTPMALRQPLSTTLPQVGLPYGQKNKSCETLPLIDSYHSAIPRLNRSSLDLRNNNRRETTVIPPGALPRSLKPNPNPTRKQRGILRILNHEENLSRIPLPLNQSSMDDMELTKQRKSSIELFNFHVRRRSSSTSPERLSSTQTTSDRRSSILSTITTSDLSYRKPLLTTQTQRQKSLFPLTGFTTQRRQSVFTDTNRLTTSRSGRSKISKPTTLSPILGTPNKDSSTPQSPEAHNLAVQTGQIASGTLSDLTLQRGSLSNIPISNHTDARGDLQSTLHPGSPLKEFIAQLPLSGRTSRATSSRLPSRATAFNTIEPMASQQTSSRANSRAADSRSTSRASTRPISRGSQSRGPSRSSSRPNSRMDQSIASVSPVLARQSRGTTPNRRKSISLSPKVKHTLLVRKKSKSSDDKKVASARSRTNKQTTSSNRSISLSRIPTLAKGSPTKSSVESATKLPKKSKLPIGVSPTKSTAGKSMESGKQPASAKKTPTTVLKTESNVTRTASSVGKQEVTVKKGPSHLRRGTPTQQSKGKKGATVQADGDGSGRGGNDSNITGGDNGSAIGGGNVDVGRDGDIKTGVNAKQVTRGGSQQSLRKTAGTPITALSNGAERTKLGTPGSLKNGILPVAKQVSAAVLQAAEVGPAAPTEVATAIPAVAGVGFKRQGSNMSSLGRMNSRLSLKDKKLTEPAVPELPSTAMSAASTKDGAGQLVFVDTAILEETSQNAVCETTGDIHKTIHGNLIDLNSLDTDMSIAKGGFISPTASAVTVVPKTGESSLRMGTADDSFVTVKSSTEPKQISPVPPSQPIEAAVSVLNVGAASVATDVTERVSDRTISVLPEVDCESANLQNYKLDVDAIGVDEQHALTNEALQQATDDFKVDAKRRSPDGQGSTIGSGGGGGKTDSQEFLEPKDVSTTPPKGCCRCCTTLCMPCRRARCSRCCTRNKQSQDEKQPVLSASSSATTASNLEVINETKSDVKKMKISCWQKLNCCRNCLRKKKDQIERATTAEMPIAKTVHEKTTTTAGDMGPKKQGKCGVCLSKIFCCRRVNKVDPKTGNEMQIKKCCFCIPCQRKQGPRVSVAAASRSPAWQDPESGITATDASVLQGTDAATVRMVKEGCCKRFWSHLLCCRTRRARRASYPRRQSIKAQPTTEDTRRKLHADLVEYTSKMKGAIPVLPLYLAWFCAICNTLIPGLGTLLSGFFCICVGIPRFSQYDSARARIGSFIINIIVAMAQMFCVLFCFVGWGWSIWWGTIMLKCAKKLNKIKKIERFEMEEEQRQAEATAAAARNAHVEIEAPRV